MRELEGEKQRFNASLSAREEDILVSDREMQALSMRLKGELRERGEAAARAEAVAEELRRALKGAAASGMTDEISSGTDGNSSRYFLVQVYCYETFYSERVFFVWRVEGALFGVGCCTSGDASECVNRLWSFFVISGVCAMFCLSFYLPTTSVKGATGSVQGILVTSASMEDIPRRVCSARSLL